MTIEQLRARVAQLEQAIDRAKDDSAQASNQLEKEEDEGAVLRLWARITARKNAGKTLVEQLAVAREELAAVETAAAVERYKAAQKVYIAAAGEMAKSAATTLALAEKAADALDDALDAGRAAGEKRKSLPTVGGWRGADPVALILESYGFDIRGTWDNLAFFRPENPLPQSSNPYTLGLGGGR